MKGYGWEEFRLTERWSLLVNETGAERDDINKHAYLGDDILISVNRSI